MLVELSLDPGPGPGGESARSAMRDQIPGDRMSCSSPAGKQHCCNQ